MNSQEKKKCMLIILDGWGVGDHNESNPICMAKTPTIDFIESNFPAGALQSSGISVGLPWEDPGSSEIGHTAIGTGILLYQNYPRISLAIRDKSFFENETLREAFTYAEKNNSSIHCIGTLSTGIKEAAEEHIRALLEMKKQKYPNISTYLHIVIGNEEGNSEETEKMVQKFLTNLPEKETILASITGDYFFRTTEQNIKNIEPALRILVSENITHTKTIPQAFTEAREKNKIPNFMEPVCLSGFQPIKENDVVLFWNFEPAGQDILARILSKIQQENISLPIPKNIFVTTMTTYDEKIPHIIFPAEKYKITFGEVLAQAGKRQMRIAESLRNHQVGFYFNGLHEEPSVGEYRTIIPSLKTLSAVDHPECMARTITDRAQIALHEGSFDFILLNYINADLLASTGNFEATKKAIEIVDAEIEKILSIALPAGYSVVLVGSHGNAERILDLETGKPTTKNKAHPVPFYIVNQAMKKSITKRPKKLQTIGILTDVAPTLLALMEIPCPSEMTGENLLRELVY